MKTTKKYELELNTTMTTGYIYDVFEKGLCKGILIVDDDFQDFEAKELTIKLEK